VKTNIAWATHPRHLPKPPAGRVVVVDVAFAAGGQWKTKTKPFVDALGERLAKYVDHHFHKDAWPHYEKDARFLLVPNKIAHACPELVTADLVREVGAVDTVVAHCDFDGALSAVKWLNGGREPWPGADEDARAIDSPGRGHTLTEAGARIAYAMDEASARFERDEQIAFMTAVALACVEHGARGFDLGLEEQVRELSEAAHAAEQRDRETAKARGEMIGGLHLVRVDEKLDNRSRKNLLVYGEEKARIGALLEPDPAGGHWLYAATFDQTLDLEDVEGFAGGRSDFRFARAHAGGQDLIDALVAYAAK
jgi:hypothetical protein